MSFQAEYYCTSLVNVVPTKATIAVSLGRSARQVILVQRPMAAALSQ